MKIGIDTFGCNHSKSGPGSYLLNFISNLPENEDIKVELFGTELDKYTYTSDNGLNYVSVNLVENLKIEQKWHKLKIASFLKKNAYDYAIFPACENVIPSRYGKTKGIVVVNSILSKQMESLSNQYKRQMKKGLSRAYKIIAASEFIKDDLVSLGYSERKICVIPNGIDHRLFFPAVNLDEEIVSINPFAIKRPYFVYATRISGPEKKHIELVKAFEIFKKNTGLPHRLVIAGDGAEDAGYLQEIICKSEYSSDIFIVGFFPTESLPKLYGAAEACVFPSEVEGVGLPVLEAMACGIPVLCSGKGALREIGGNAALYFNSADTIQMAQLMEKIIVDKEMRNELVQKGLENAARYNWQDTVLKTFELLQKK